MRRNKNNKFNDFVLTDVMQVTPIGPTVRFWFTGDHLGKMVDPKRTWCIGSGNVGYKIGERFSNCFEAYEKLNFQKKAFPFN